MMVAGNNSGGEMDVRVGSTTGTLLGTYVMSASGGWASWVPRTLNFSATVSGTHNLFLVGKSGTGIFNIDHFNPVTGGTAPVCGDSVCEGTETCSSCAADCGTCAAVCGNGSCQSGEDCNNCAADCGGCSGSATLQAESASSVVQPVVQQSTQVIISGSGGAMCWNNVNMSGKTSATVHYSNGEPAGDTLTLKYGGTTLGTATVSNCGAWEGSCTTATINFGSQSGSGQLCLEGTGGNYIASVDKVEL
jgi:hypothetical protein